ncbi:ATP-binding cassette domain-containing protein [Microvirga subterranea]|uniref:ABC-2 type transport system ATP-binding protein n=1 Tax=Microvirga subterranea TaxID=186651 RepID=A0A370HRN7_9HYPH|nr:ATP-binding cassette domain-containing protein [Microvirga subterranea]RDI61206.1 ABC-2 type transport system ATP-binding protein [Microvirga subterranea]
MTALFVQGVSHGFGRRQVLSDVTFSIPPATMTVLLGPNGAGKTTLVSLVTGLYSAHHGDIQVFGHSMREAPLLGLAKMGVVFQMPTLDPDLTVSDNLAYHAALHGLSRSDARERERIELERLGIPDRRLEKVRTLSGGLRRRVELARALLHRPSLLIVDEATAGLDVASRRLFLEHVRILCQEGISVLWATHMLDEVAPHDPLLVLHQGRLCWSGRAANLAAGTSLADAFLWLTGGSK